MFIKSAASYTDQGKAIQAINEKWGDGASGTRRPWGGRETIGIQVCKKKYTPFLFSVETQDDDENDAKNCNGTAASNGERKRVVKVVRMFGCPHHSAIRKEKIECHGVRKGWEPFGQWSLQKAHALARRETIRLNRTKDVKGNDNRGGETNHVLSKTSNNTSTDENDGANSDSNLNMEEIRTICHNGKCLWKKRNKFDNVYNEITGYSESSSEEDV